MNLFTEQLNLSNEPIQKSPIKLPVMDENGEKFAALEKAYFHPETNAPKKEEAESK